MIPEVRQKVGRGRALVAHRHRDRGIHGQGSRRGRRDRGALSRDRERPAQDRERDLLHGRIEVRSFRNARSDVSGRTAPIDAFEGDAIRLLKTGPEVPELAAIADEADKQEKEINHTKQLAMQREADATALKQKSARVHEQGGVMGAESCKQCHQPTYDGWLATPHAQAFAALAEADAWDDPECVGCHITGADGQASRGSERRPGALERAVRGVPRQRPRAHAGRVVRDFRRSHLPQVPRLAEQPRVRVRALLFVRSALTESRCGDRGGHAHPPAEPAPIETSCRGPRPGLRAQVRGSRALGRGSANLVGPSF